MTEYRFTVRSAITTLDNQGATCVNDACRNSSDVEVDFTPGSSYTCSKESFKCPVCNTKWSAELFPAKIYSITPGDRSVEYQEYGGDDVVPEGIFNTIADPSEALKKVVNDFLKAMRRSNLNQRGEALAALALMARVDL